MAHHQSYSMAASRRSRLMTPDSNFDDPALHRDDFLYENGKVYAMPGRIERADPDILRRAFALPGLNSLGHKLMKAYPGNQFVCAQLNHYGVKFDRNEITGNGASFLTKAILAGECILVPEHILQQHNLLHKAWLNRASLQDTHHDLWLYVEKNIFELGIQGEKNKIVRTIFWNRDDLPGVKQMHNAARRIAGSRLHFQTVKGVDYFYILISWNKESLDMQVWELVTKENERYEALLNERDSGYEELHEAYLQRNKSKDPQRKFSPAGSYLIACEVIERQWETLLPGFMALLVSGTQDPDIFTGNFDFGVIAGEMLLSKDKSEGREKAMAEMLAEMKPKPVPVGKFRPRKRRGRPPKSSQAEADPTSNVSGGDSKAPDSGSLGQVNTQPIADSSMIEGAWSNYTTIFSADGKPVTRAEEDAEALSAQVEGPPGPYLSTTGGATWLKNWTIQKHITPDREMASGKSGLLTDRGLAPEPSMTESAPSNDPPSVGRELDVGSRREADLPPKENRLLGPGSALSLDASGLDVDMDLDSDIYLGEETEAQPKIDDPPTSSKSENALPKDIPEIDHGHIPDSGLDIDMDLDPDTEPSQNIEARPSIDDTSGSTDTKSVVPENALEVAHEPSPDAEPKSKAQKARLSRLQKRLLNIAFPPPHTYHLLIRCRDTGKSKEELTRDEWMMETGTMTFEDETMVLFGARANLNFVGNAVTFGGLKISDMTFGRQEEDDDNQA